MLLVWKYDICVAGDNVAKYKRNEVSMKNVFPDLYVISFVLLYILP